jgi:hypothetical protein
MKRRDAGQLLKLFLAGMAALSVLYSLGGCAPQGSEKEAKKEEETPAKVSQESSPTPSPPAPTPPADAGDVLGFQGSGGMVRIGDTLETAKKAMPPQKGAYETGPTSFLVFNTEGWAWFTTENTTGFEVMLRGGKVDGIAYTDSGKSHEVYQRRVEEAIKRLGEPTRQAKGKSSAVWVWQKGDYARIEVIAEMAPNQSFYLCFIGRETDLKVLNYRPDDPQTLVMQMDLSADLARKELNKSRSTGKGK